MATWFDSNTPRQPIGGVGGGTAVSRPTNIPVNQPPPGWTPNQQQPDAEGWIYMPMGSGSMRYNPTTGVRETQFGNGGWQPFGGGGNGPLPGTVQPGVGQLPSGFFGSDLPADPSKITYAPAGAPAGTNTNPNYQVGTFTGGGQYPLASVMGTGLAQPWTTPFVAPNDVTQQTAPGFQFRLGEGLKALQRSAAAKGTLLTGGTLKDINNYAQEFASNEFEKVYNRALGEYKDAYTIFKGNQGDLYSRLYGISGAGLNAAGAAGGAAQNYAAGGSGTLTGMGNVQGAGTAAQGNIWGSTVPAIAGTVADVYNMYKSRQQPPTTLPTGFETTGVVPWTPPGYKVPGF